MDKSDIQSLANLQDDYIIRCKELETRCADLKKQNQALKNEVKALNKGVRSWEKSAMANCRENSQLKERLKKHEQPDTSVVGNNWEPWTVR